MYQQFSQIGKNTRISDVNKTNSIPSKYWITGGLSKDHCIQTYKPLSTEQLWTLRRKVYADAMLYSRLKRKNFDVYDEKKDRSKTSRNIGEIDNKNDSNNYTSSHTNNSVFDDVSLCSQLLVQMRVHGMLFAQSVDTFYNTNTFAFWNLNTTLGDPRFAIASSSTSENLFLPKPKQKPTTYNSDGSSMNHKPKNGTPYLSLFSKNTEQNRSFHDYEAEEEFQRTSSSDLIVTEEEPLDPVEYSPYGVPRHIDLSYIDGWKPDLIVYSAAMLSALSSAQYTVQLSTTSKYSKNNSYPSITPNHQKRYINYVGIYNAITSYFSEMFQNSIGRPFTRNNLLLISGNRNVGFRDKKMENISQYISLLNTIPVISDSIANNYNTTSPLSLIARYTYDPAHPIHDTRMFYIPIADTIQKYRSSSNVPEISTIIRDTFTPEDFLVTNPLFVIAVEQGIAEDIIQKVNRDQNILYLQDTSIFEDKGDDINMPRIKSLKRVLMSHSLGSENVITDLDIAYILHSNSFKHLLQQKHVQEQDHEQENVIDVDISNTSNSISNSTSKSKSNSTSIGNTQIIESLYFSSVPADLHVVGSIASPTLLDIFHELRTMPFASIKHGGKPYHKINSIVKSQNSQNSQKIPEYNSQGVNVSTHSGKIGTSDKTASQTGVGSNSNEIETEATSTSTTTTTTTDEETTEEQQQHLLTAEEVDDLEDIRDYTRYVLEGRIRLSDDIKSQLPSKIRKRRGILPSIPPVAPEKMRKKYVLSDENIRAIEISLEEIASISNPDVLSSSIASGQSLSTSTLQALQKEKDDKLRQKNSFIYNNPDISPKPVLEEDTLRIVSASAKSLLRHIRKLHDPTLRPHIRIESDMFMSYLSALFELSQSSFAGYNITMDVLENASGSGSGSGSEFGSHGKVRHNKLIENINSLSHSAQSAFSVMQTFPFGVVPQSNHIGAMIALSHASYITSNPTLDLTAIQSFGILSSLGEDVDVDADGNVVTSTTSTTTPTPTPTRASPTQIDMPTNASVPLSTRFFTTYIHSIFKDLLATDGFLPIRKTIAINNAILKYYYHSVLSDSQQSQQSIDIQNKDMKKVIQSIRSHIDGPNNDWLQVPYPTDRITSVLFMIDKVSQPYTLVDENYTGNPNITHNPRNKQVYKEALEVEKEAKRLNRTLAMRGEKPLYKGFNRWALHHNIIQGSILDPSNNSNSNSNSNDDIKKVNNHHQNTLKYYDASNSLVTNAVDQSTLLPTVDSTTIENINMNGTGVLPSQNIGLLSLFNRNSVSSALMKPQQSEFKASDVLKAEYMIRLQEAFLTRENLQTYLRDKNVRKSGKSQPHSQSHSQSQSESQIEDATVVSTSPSTSTSNPNVLTAQNEVLQPAISYQLREHPTTSIPYSSMISPSVYAGYFQPLRLHAGLNFGIESYATILSQTKDMKGMYTLLNTVGQWERLALQSMKQSASMESTITNPDISLSVDLLKDIMASSAPYNGIVTTTVQRGYPYYSKFDVSLPKLQYRKNSRSNTATTAIPSFNDNTNVNLPRKDYDIALRACTSVLHETLLFQILYAFGLSSVLQPLAMSTSLNTIFSTSSTIADTKTLSTSEDQNQAQAQDQVKSSKSKSKFIQPQQPPRHPLDVFLLLDTPRYWKSDSKNDFNVRLMSEEKMKTILEHFTTVFSSTVSDDVTKNCLPSLETLLETMHETIQSNIVDADIIHEKTVDDVNTTTTIAKPLSPQCVDVLPNRFNFAINPYNAIQRIEHFQTVFQQSSTSQFEAQFQFAESFLSDPYTFSIVQFGPIALSKDHPARKILEPYSRTQRLGMPFRYRDFGSTTSLQWLQTAFPEMKIITLHKQQDFNTMKQAQGQGQGHGHEQGLDHQLGQRKANESTSTTLPTSKITSDYEQFIYALQDVLIENSKIGAQWNLLDDITYTNIGTISETDQNSDSSFKSSHKYMTNFPTLNELQQLFKPTNRSKRTSTTTSSKQASTDSTTTTATTSTHSIKEEPADKASAINALRSMFKLPSTSSTKAEDKADESENKSEGKSEVHIISPPTTPIATLTPVSIPKPIATTQPILEYVRRYRCQIVSSYSISDLICIDKIYRQSRSQIDKSLRTFFLTDSVQLLTQRLLIHNFIENTNEQLDNPIDEMISTQYPVIDATNTANTTNTNKNNKMKHDSIPKNSRNNESIYKTIDTPVYLQKILDRTPQEQYYQRSRSIVNPFAERFYSYQLYSTILSSFASELTGITLSQFIKTIQDIKIVDINEKNAKLDSKYIPTYVNPNSNPYFNSISFIMKLTHSALQRHAFHYVYDVYQVQKTATITPIREVERPLVEVDFHNTRRVQAISILSYLFDSLINARINDIQNTVQRKQKQVLVHDASTFGSLRSSTKLKSSSSTKSLSPSLLKNIVSKDYFQSAPGSTIHPVKNVTTTITNTNTNTPTSTSTPTVSNTSTPLKSTLQSSIFGTADEYQNLDSSILHSYIRQQNPGAVDNHNTLLQVSGVPFLQDPSHLLSLISVNGLSILVGNTETSTLRQALISFFKVDDLDGMGDMDDINATITDIVNEDDDTMNKTKSKSKTRTTNTVVESYTYSRIKISREFILRFIDTTIQNDPIYGPLYSNALSMKYIQPLQDEIDQSIVNVYTMLQSKQQTQQLHNITIPDIKQISSTDKVQFSSILSEMNICSGTTESEIAKHAAAIAYSHYNTTITTLATSRKADNTRIYSQALFTEFQRPSHVVENVLEKYIIQKPQFDQDAFDQFESIEYVDHKDRKTISTTNMIIPMVDDKIMQIEKAYKATNQLSILPNAFNTNSMTKNQDYIMIKQEEYRLQQNTQVLNTLYDYFKFRYQKLHPKNYFYKIHPVVTGSVSASAVSASASASASSSSTSSKGQTFNRASMMKEQEAKSNRNINTMKDKIRHEPVVVPSSTSSTTTSETSTTIPSTIIPERRVKSKSVKSNPIPIDLFESQHFMNNNDDDFLPTKSQNQARFKLQDAMTRKKD